MLNDANGILLERTRGGLVEASQAACSAVDERIQGEFNLIAEVRVELIQRGGPEVLATRSFVSEPESEIWSGSCSSGGQKSKITSHHAVDRTKARDRKSVV